LPCSQGKADPVTGKLCPYIESEPLTIEGFEAWHVVQKNLFKFLPNGKLSGFCLSTILSICSTVGYDSRAVLHLLEYAEAGLQEAINKHGNSNSEHINTDSSY
jgi:hypothetical protein